MKRAIALGVVMTLVALAAPARADHNTRVAPADGSAVDETTTQSALDISLKLGPNAFRFGTRFFGRDGYAGGAWLNGETRADGFSVDGRVEHGGKAHNFKFNADIDDWLRRAIRWWGTTDL